MKQKITFLASLLLLGLVFTSCQEKKVFCISGEGEREAYTLEVSEFNGIDLQIQADVTLSQGPVQEVIVTAAPNIVENIEVRVADGIWEIDYDDCVKRSEDVTIDITLPDLTFAQISGSGSITGLTAFTDLNDLELNICGSGNMDMEADCNELLTKITGSGDMDLDMDCSSIESKITGSGNLDFSGTSPSHSIEITGSGNLRGFDLPTDDTNIRISGSGDCEVMANNNLDVKISGSGDVYYKGTPGINVDISGSGKLINAN